MRTGYEVTARRPRRGFFAQFRPDPILGPNGFHNVAIDTLQSALAGLFVALVVNFASVYAQRLQAGPVLLSVLLAAPFTGALLSPLVIARLPATVAPRSIAIVIALGRMLILLTPFTRSPAVFIALIFGMYLLVTLPSPYIVDVMGRLYPPSIRGRYIGYSRVALTLGLILGAPIGGFVLDNYGPAILFPLGAAIGTLGAVAYAFLRPGPAAPSARRSSLATTFRLVGENGRYALVVAALAVWGFGVLVAGPYYPVILVGRFGVTYSQVGFLSLVQSACWFASYLYLARRIDRLPAGAVLGVSMFLSALLPISFLLAPTPMFLAIGYAGNGFASGGVDLGLLQVIVRAAPPGGAPRYTALVNAVAGARGMLAPFAGSALGSEGVLGTAGVLVAGGVMCLAGGALALRGSADPAPRQGSVLPIPVPD